MRKKDEFVQTTFVILGLIIIFGLIYGLWILSVKILGIMLIAGGILIMVYIPDIESYQPKSFTDTIIKIGIIIVIIGIIFLVIG